MKRLLIVTLMGMAALTMAFADHPADKLGIGGVASLGYGGFDLDASVALSLKAPNVPIFWGLSGRLGQDRFGLGITADFYIFEWNLTDNIATNDDGSYHVKIDWYLGLGLYGNFDFWEEYVGGGGGLRIPFGVSWHALEQLEVAVGIAPSFGFYGIKDPDIHPFSWAIPLELAVRYWVK